MKPCSECGNEGGFSAVIDGTYFSDLCSRCLGDLQAPQNPTSGQASYNRQRDIEDNASMLVQPYENGKPNETFRRVYPGKAERYFTDEQLRKSL